MASGRRDKEPGDRRLRAVNPIQERSGYEECGMAVYAVLMQQGSKLNMARGTGYIPTRKSVLTTDEGKAFLAQKPEFQIIFDNLDIITPGIQRTDWSQVSTTWRNWMDEIIQEDLDVETALKEMEVEINEILSGS